MLLLLLWLAVASAGDTWTEPREGLRLLERTTTSPNQHIFAAYVELCADLHPRATRYEERQVRTSTWGGDIGAVVAINGAFFNFSGYDAIGWSIGAGETWPTAVDYPDFTSVALASRGRMRIFDPDLPLPPEGQDWWTEMVPGRPLLVDDGEVIVEPCFSHMCERHPRTAVGITDDGHALLVAVDGRRTSAVGMTRLELAALLQDLGARRALNLDGGGSTTLWVDGLGVVNQPSDGSERVVSSHLGFVPGEGVGCCRREPVDGPTGTFADIPAGHWAEPYAEALFEAGVTSGCQADPPLFCPGCVLERSHLGVLVARGLGLDPLPPVTFTDVPPGAWYAGYLEALYQAGITSGCAEGRFCPERFATRWEAAAFIFRGMGLEPAEPTGRFADASPSQAPVLEALAEACVVSGCAGDAFCPGQEVTRAQVAKMLAVGLAVPPHAPCEPGDGDTGVPDTGESDSDDPPGDEGSGGGRVAAEEGCGCTTGSAAGPVLLIGLLALLRRRAHLRRGA